MKRITRATLIVTCMFALRAYAGEPIGEDPVPGTPYRPGLMIGSQSAYQPLKASPQISASPKGINTVERKSPIDNIMVSGVMRFITYARWMDTYYNDMQTGPKNISFLDYPQASSSGAAAGAGFPMLELNLQSKLSPNFEFNIGYSMLHPMNGTPSAATMSSRQNLRFTGFWNTKGARFYFAAGGMLWTTLSRFTMSQPDYRDNYFDRMPWDWYRNSFLRYDEYYSLATNIGNESSGRAPVLGYVISGDFHKLGLKFTGVYGRTNTNTSQGNGINFFPSLTYAGRLEKLIFTRWVNGRVGLTGHSRQGYITRSSDQKDNTELFTTDFALKFKPLKVSGELGIGRVQAPASSGDWGAAVDVKVEFDKHTLWLPLSVEYYNIDINCVSLDGAILNSNKAAEGGGYGTTPVWDAYLFVNVAQEVGQIANNRQGLILRTDKQFGKFKISFNLDMSEEKINLYDTITFQHRVNAFSRSRFNAWRQAGGPYGRIKSVWMRTFETLTITDPAGTGAYKKGFNGMELFIRYKTLIFGKELVVLNYNSFNSIQDHFTPLPVFSDEAFIRVFYEDLNFAYKIGRKWNVCAFGGIERAFGNERVNTVVVDGVTKTVDQFGYGYGAGIDWDFAKNAGLHMRHRWMYQKDQNFVNDTFKGQETVVEVKVFF